MTDIPNSLPDHHGSTLLAAPDIEVDAREVFGVDIDMKVPAFSEADERVPDLDPAYVFDGEAAVRSYFAASREPFPDQANEVIAIAADAATNTVLDEFWLTGTHLGPLKLGPRTIEATGKAFRIRMAASFEFAPGSDKIVCERPYYDQSAVMKALGLL